jgi:hypothetical protein
MVALAERLRLELDSSDRKNLVGSQMNSCTSPRSTANQAAKEVAARTTETHSHVVAGRSHGSLPAAFMNPPLS